MNLLSIISDCLAYANAFTDVNDAGKAEIFLDKLEDEGYIIVERYHE